jgi:hypothetical protein
MSADRYAGPHPVSLLISTKEVVGLSQASIDNRLLGLPGPYHRHAIAMNTCSRGANPSVLNWHRRGLQPPKGLTQSQVIQSQHSLKWNGVKHLWLTMVFRPLAVYRSLYQHLAIAIVIQILSRSSRVTWKIIIMQLRFQSTPDQPNAQSFLT